MADFFASRPMEDFFINPTIADPSHHLSSFPMPSPSMDQAAQYRVALRDYHHQRRSSSTNDSALKHFALPTRVAVSQRRTDYWQGYQSEEEQPSPVEQDSSSSQAEEPTSVGSDASFAIASSFSMSEQQCSEATVVMIQPAGRARMVSLPKLVTIQPRKTVARPVEQIHIDKRPSPHHRDGSEQSARTSQDSASSFTTSSSLASPTSTAPSSVDESYDKSKHRRAISRHVPLIEAAQAITPTSPHFPQSANFIRRGSASSFSQVPYSPVAKPQRKKSKFNLNRAFALGASKKGDERSLHSIAEPAMAPLATKQAQSHPRTFSMNRTRLIARGAGDREPAIRLPPSPFGC